MDTNLLNTELANALSKHSVLPAPESSQGGGSAMSADQIMEREFLEMRALILQLAASLDRIGRSKSPAADEKKLEQIRLGVQILHSDKNNRANLVQMLFSNPYSQQWPANFSVILDPNQRS